MIAILVWLAADPGLLTRAVALAAVHEDTAIRRSAGGHGELEAWR